MRPEDIRVLVACEFSEVVKEQFLLRGFDAHSCDLLPGEKGLPNHHQCDVREILNDGWDLMIAHPPCTYLTVTGNKWFLPAYKDRFPTRQQDREDAVKFFMMLVNAPIDKIGTENPVGIMSTLYRKPDQIINPYQFGHPERKKTCLWLKNLPLLVPTDIVEPISYYAGGKPYSPTHYMSRRSLNHLDCLPPMKDRWKLRSRTFLGIAVAMAEQWGSFLQSLQEGK